MNRWRFWRLGVLSLALGAVVALAVPTASALPMNPLDLLPGPLMGVYGVERPLVTGAGYQDSPSIYGNLVAYQDKATGDYDVKLFNTKTNTVYGVSVHAGSVQQSPRIWGNRIVWMDNRSGNWDIWWYDIAKRQEHRLTTAGTNESYPKLYGDRVVWQDDRNGNSDIYLYDFSTGTTRRITSDVSNQTSPAIWGDRIAWVDARNLGTTGTDIYWYDVGASREYRLSSDPDGEFSVNLWGNRAVWSVSVGMDTDLVVAFYFDASGAILQTAGGSGVQDNGAIYGDTLVWLDTASGFYNTRIHRFGGVGAQLLRTGGFQESAKVWGDVVVWGDSRTGGYDIYGMQLFSPKLTLSAPPTAGHDTATPVSGYLRAWDGTPLSNRLIQVQYMPHKNILTTATWPIVDTNLTVPAIQLAKTNSLGKFTAFVPPQATRFYVRAHFAGDADAYWQTSSQRTVLPKVSLAKPVGKSTVSNTKSYTYYGYLKPYHTPGTTRVWLKCYRKVGSKYVLKKTYAATLSDYSTYSKYSAKIKLGTEGKWRIRAYYKQTFNNAATYSSYKYVTSN